MVWEWIVDHATVLATVISTIAAGVIAGFTIVLARVGRATDRNFRQVERAYVKMSHCSPGLGFLAGGSDVQIEIRNHGTTPGSVTNAFLTFKILREGEVLPNPPVYNTPTQRARIRAFLVADDYFFFRELLAVGLDEVRAMPNGSTLCVFGFVDYIDVFGTRHRGGYGRVYHPHDYSNNLVFAAQDGYNYDRVRIPGEGVDWEETQFSKG